MKIVDGCVVREQNLNDVDDSCFDTSELVHMLYRLGLSKFKFAANTILYTSEVDVSWFIDDNNKLQRHPNTHFKDDISSDQADMYLLGTLAGGYVHTRAMARAQIINSGMRTSNGDPVSPGLFARIKNWQWLANLVLVLQIFLFLIPVRWCDGENPDFRLWKIKLNIGSRHWCGDYRLFKQCLYYAPWWIKRLVSKTRLHEMTRFYWASEPNSQGWIDIDDQFVETCLKECRQ